MTRELKGRVAVITGAASGDHGLAMCERLAAAGMNLVGRYQ